MARKEVVMRRIAHGPTRRATYKKRRKGLIKKAGEFATLCAVDTALVVYGEGQSEPVVWPSPEEAARVMNRFRAVPDMGRYKHMHDTASLMKQQIERMKARVRKLQQGSSEREKKLLLIQALGGRLPGGGVQDLTPEQLSSLGWMVGKHQKALHKTMRQLGLSLPAAAPPPPPVVPSLPPVAFTTHAGQAPQPQQGWAWPAPAPAPFTTYAGQASQPQQGWAMGGMTGAGGHLGALANAGGFGGAFGSFGGMPAPAPALSGFGGAFGGFGGMPATPALGGFGGAFGSFGGVGDAGAGTSAAGAGMPPLLGDAGAGAGMPLLFGNVPAGFLPWGGGDAGAGPSSSRLI
ncbi:hypothetical protein ACP4OV_007498 [Aristida adscensionis]